MQIKSIKLTVLGVLLSSQKIFGKTDFVNKLKKFRETLLQKSQQNDQILPDDINPL